MAGEKRRSVIAIISIVVIVVCVILIIQWAKKRGGVPTEYQVKTICEKCNKTSVQKIKGASDFPLTCPYCKERACWELYKCYECGKEFPKKPGQMVTSCPECGSPKVGAAPVSE